MYTDAELKTLRARCIRAVERGFRLAHETVMVNQLGAETQVLDAPYGIRKGSTKHLLYLVEEAQAQREGTTTVQPVRPTPTPAPVVAAVEVAVAEVAEEVAEVAEEVAEVAEEVAEVAEEAVVEVAEEVAEVAEEAVVEVAEPEPEVAVRRERTRGAVAVAEKVVPPYEKWDMKELYAEAKARDISGRSNMSKDELITALYDYDEENP